MSRPTTWVVCSTSSRPAIIYSCRPLTSSTSIYLITDCCGGRSVCVGRRLSTPRRLLDRGDNSTHWRFATVCCHRHCVNRMSGNIMTSTVSLVSTTPSCSHYSTGFYLSGPSPVGAVPRTHGSMTSAGKLSDERAVWNALHAVPLVLPLPTRQLITSPPQQLLTTHGQQNAVHTATFVTESARSSGRQRSSQSVRRHNGYGGQ